MTVRVNKDSFNLREKLSELERPIGLKGSELMSAETVQEARDLVSAGRKNLMINGGFEVSQRGNYTSATSAAHNVYYLDRWKADIGSVTATFNQITTDLPKQYRNLSNTGLRFQATSTNVNGYLGFRQRYEHMDGIDGKYVTVSAWVKSNKNAVLIHYDGSGAPNQYAQHSGGGSWEYLSYTTFINHSGDYNYFDIFIIDPVTYGYTPISSGDYVEVTNYQVEIGKNATDFEHRSIGEELALCQRYYQSTNRLQAISVPLGQYGETAYVGWQYDNTNGSLRLRFPVEMRVGPTATVVGSVSTSPGASGTIGAYGTGGWMTLSSISVTAATPLSIRINTAGMSGSGKDAFGLYFYGTYLTSTITLDAEIG